MKLFSFNLNRLWLGIILSIVLILPIQVLFNSPIPFLLPYFLFFIYIFFSKTIKYQRYKKKSVQKNIDYLIFIYTLLVLFHFTWQLLLSVSSISDLLSSLVIYFLPTFFYYYLKKNITSEILFLILIGICLSGIIVGIYFVYDSYMQLILGKISNYSVLVNEYEQFRKNSTEINNARLKMFERAYGLLETHSVSSAWVSFACFSALTLIRNEFYVKRILVIFITLIILFIGLNFTGILAFILSIILIEFNLFKLFKFKISLIGLRHILYICILLFTSLVIIYLILPSENQSMVLNLLNYFPQLLSGDLITRDDNRTYLQGLSDSLFGYPKLMFNYFPLGLLIGDGFTVNFGLNKGGDYGIVETLYRFGIPFFLLFIIAIFRLIYFLFNSLYINGNNKIIKFCALILVYVLISELHYSIWNSKSILALLFIVFAIIYKQNQPLKISLEK